MPLFLVGKSFKNSVKELIAAVLDLGFGGTHALYRPRCINLADRTHDGLLIRRDRVGRRISRLNPAT
jgi:hypothetical protein